MNIQNHPNTQEHTTPNSQEVKTREVERDFHYYLGACNVSAEEIPNILERKGAFIAGYIAALRRHHVYDDALFLQGHQLETHILGDLIFAEKKSEDRIRSNSRAIVKEFGGINLETAVTDARMAITKKYGNTDLKTAFRNMTEKGRDHFAITDDDGNLITNDKRLFRGMVFDCGAMDENGRELDHETLEPVDEHHSWPHVAYVHETTGIVVANSYYQSLAGKERAEYTCVRRYGAVLFTDVKAMLKLIAEDIAIGDPAVNKRYLMAAMNPDSELHRYRKAIYEAFDKVGMCAHMEGCTPLYLGHIDISNLTEEQINSLRDGGWTPDDTCKD